MESQLESTLDRDRPPPLRILVVDDHPASLRAACSLLRLEGYDATAATSVASAVAAGRSAAFDLLLCGVGLPDGAAADVLRALREAGPIRGIAVSGSGAEADVRRSLDAGFAAHLFKPLVAERLLEAVRRAAAGESLPPA